MVQNQAGLIWATKPSLESQGQPEHLSAYNDLQLRKGDESYVRPTRELVMFLVIIYVTIFSLGL